MTNLFKNIQRHALIRGVIYAILGVAILFQPREFFNVLIYFIAGYNALLGAINLISALKEKQNTQMAAAIFYFVFALIILLFAKPLISVLPIFLGILIIIGGATRITQSMRLKEYVNVNYLPMMIYGILLVIAGVLILFNPFKTWVVLFQFFGITMIVTGISEIITFIRYRNIEF